jgi:uroporphyrinogen III methyltransferase/synthase
VSDLDRSGPPTTAIVLDETDRLLLNNLQGGFPVTHRPFAEVALRLGLDEDDVIARLRALVRPGDAVLLPRAADARDVLVTELARLGATVVEVAAYRTRPVTDGAARVRAALERGEVDIVTFTSSSTVRNFAALFTGNERRRLLSRVAIAAIGPITADTAASFGLATRIMPAEYTIPALTRAIAAYFSNASERS